VTKMVASVRNKGKLLHWRKNDKLFTLRVFVLRDGFWERINRVIRGFAVLTNHSSPARDIIPKTVLAKAASNNKVALLSTKLHFR
jgi:hypothetical protein